MHRSQENRAVPRVIFEPCGAYVNTWVIGSVWLELVDKYMLWWSSTKSRLLLLLSLLGSDRGLGPLFDISRVLYKQNLDNLSEVSHSVQYVQEEPYRINIYII